MKVVIGVFKGFIVKVECLFFVEGCFGVGIWYGYVIDREFVKYVVFVKVDIVKYSIFMRVESYFYVLFLLVDDVWVFNVEVWFIRLNDVEFF